MTVSHIDLIDGNWARATVDFARRAGAKSPVLNYGALAARLDLVREEAGLPPAEKRVAVVALDFDNESQRKLVEAMGHHGIAVAQVDFRHSYVSVPAPYSESETRAPNPQSLSHWITYMCGIMAARERPSVVVVSGAHELAGPLDDLVRARGGTAVLAYFRRLLNKRWIDNGLLESEMSVRFADLEPYSHELLGVDLREAVRKSASARQEPGLPI